MKKILSYLILPKEITQFEHDYLVRMNRIALWFFCAHVPVFMAVAALCSTGVLKAAVLSSLTLAGPGLAYLTFINPRHISKVFGFTAMCLGGLLVHFGQGAMQIEMHFYFFVLIALLAVFSNPVVILIAAVTVAAHHLLLFFLLPRSVFNYEASVWAVVIHALFVVLESIAACFVARSFFDNVIGLEKIVLRRTDELAVRTREMRLVFDNVGQGFLMLTLNGSMSAERSAVLQSWLGSSEPQEPFWRYIARTDANAGTWFEIGWESITDGVLPLELALEQMPKRMKAAERTLEFRYKPIFHGQTLHTLLVILSDITIQLAQESHEVEQREMMLVFERILKDRTGFLEFLAEASDLVHVLTQNSNSAPEDVKRFVHTLKGNSSTFGLSRIAQLCHQIEDHFEGTCGVLSESDRAHLAETWALTKTRLGSLFDQRSELLVEIDDVEYNSILRAVVEGAVRPEIVRMIESWKLEPSEKRLERIAEQARAIAKRLHKGDINIQLQPNGLRFSQEHWAPFWSSFTHAIRNAIDHGIELPEEREQSGKPSVGQITLRTELTDGHVVVSIEDDGRGVDWQKLTELAKKNNLPHATQNDLTNLLFASGITTKDSATEYSGRGVGMGAIRSMCQEMGGSVDIHTEPGRGTRIDCRIPQGFLNPVAGMLGLPPASAALKAPLAVTTPIQRRNRSPRSPSPAGRAGAHGYRLLSPLPLVADLV